MSVTTVSRQAAAPPKAAKRPPVWRCQFCAQGHHRSCPRATRYNGVLWQCQCKEGADQHHGLYCLTCKHDSAEDVNPQSWQCFDVNSCSVRRQQRNDNNPLWRMVRAAKIHGALERKAKQLRQETLLSMVDPLQEETIERVSALLDSIAGLSRDKLTKKRKRSGPPKPTTGVCECCGAPTRGGRFLPGHDAKMASALRAKVKYGDQDAYAEMKTRGWLKKLPPALIRPEDLAELGARK